MKFVFLHVLPGRFGWAAAWSALPLVILLLLTVRADIGFELDQKLLAAIEKEHGAAAKNRLIAWQDLIAEDKSSSDLEKLVKVNDFFNRVEFVSDILLWKKTDYWATPVEFLVYDAGDCEDFSIAKYFTLKKMGVAEDKLSMTYAKALELDQAHMVVTYYETPEAEPLILDNLNPEILPASGRNDLMPIFSFNGIGLWLAKQRQRGLMVGGSDRYTRWQDLLERMPDGFN